MGLPDFIIQEFPENVRKPMVLVGNWLEENSIHKTDFTTLKSTVEELAEAQKELAEAQKELAEAQKELAEAQKRTELRVEELAEAQKRTENRVEELAVAMKELAQTVNAGFKRLNDQISTLGGRWGIQTEETFRNAVEGLLRTTGYTVTRGYYGEREVDLVVRNGDHILLEITSSCKKSDIPKYIASAEDYEKKYNVVPKIMLAAIYIHPNVMRVIADSPRKIEIFTSDEDD